MEPAFLVGTGGAIGALLRYAVGEYVPATEFPYATLIVNVIGSFVLGVLVFGGASSDTMLLIGIGACGAFTTYSSFSVQTILLFEDGKRTAAAANAIGNLVLSLGAIGLAWLLVGL
ncbi:fluoride efflux transporter CrcB [Natronocalculus amylovorans]|uniref:Fluoride-specific ion channel FluC n=1 Tax=Natronocalculus amylovorans TaxID=2917812 RepID=A0AAE3KA52_9EURY|nr:fluoride efflux transporter CrcB [Natronocalculus amylovorans]MCL9816629.1 fluoride efflux transporter CrcB [Natronocalculus amylovorans]NUE01072.1 fluoride efflux transporter CrcB [Halorubraceae archaeon YAN]